MAGADGGAGTPWRSLDRLTALVDDYDSHRYRHALESALGVPFVDGNRVTVLQNGDEIFPAMLGAIRRAEERIDFLTFIYWQGDIAADFAGALSEKARAGVEVRVLLDAYGARKIGRTLQDEMAEAGVSIRWFRPLSTWRVWRSDKRTHRKILVVDGRVGFTGGVGIADQWTGDARNPDEWRDTHMALEGPAIRGLNAAFLDNWNAAGDWDWHEPAPLTDALDGGVPVQVVRASSTVGWSDTATLLRSLVSVARVRLLLVTPYFVPDALLQKLLAEAVDRGVDVRLMLPGPHCDQQISRFAGHTSIAPLLDAGVKIWLYQKTNLHAKLVMVDGTLSCIGSANLNHRSMGKDEECCAVVLSREIAGQLENRFIEDCAESETLELDRWEKRSAWVRLRERAARLFVEQL